MINFLHNFTPEPVLISLGPINIYWYGICIVLGTITAIFVAIKLAPLYKFSKDNIVDLAFYLIISGIIGARIYNVFLEWPYYSNNPSEIFKIWHGGLAIHGAIIGGFFALIFFAKKLSKNSINNWKNIFIKLTAITVSCLPLGQAIGRWGNYFNQELFGAPTKLPWGIPIDLINRPLGYTQYSYFHPTFLYESIGNLVIFSILITLNLKLKKLNKFNNYYQTIIIASYFILYSLQRFFLEFLRIDNTFELWEWRWPQIISLIIIVIMLIILKKNKKDVKIHKTFENNN